MAIFHAHPGSNASLMASGWLAEAPATAPPFFHPESDFIPPARSRA